MADLLSLAGDATREPRPNFLLEDIIRASQGRSAFPVAVAWPLSAVSFAGAVEAAEAGIIQPIFVGKQQELTEIASTLGFDIGSCEVVPADCEEQAAEIAVELCRTGRAEALMKGSLHTDVFMHSALKKEAGLRTSRRFSHVFVLEAPLYDRTIFISDAAINIYPALEDKVDILQNVIDLAHVLGVGEPRVAILSAVETVSAKITSTIDAAALCKMADRNQITGAILDGPLAFDTAVNAEAARVKHLRSLVAGAADILLVPDLESGNMLAKQLEYLGGARLAGIVLGASVPIILTSRADSSESRVASCAIASALIASKA